ncbi:hypothetical protein Pan258_39400 [Symmachiella dynata]|uniref:Uncharacterized protein n=1 Tax=Symmachiella dynata TaxID=2527995 RepID=A0A517ZT22_9PLAN|nr:hypothetical protein Pan258_39400 [Symmachiella dynata]QDU45600.1 hypothetical protein Mal52_40940 [Symmachiella dynata]
MLSISRLQPINRLIYSEVRRRDVTVSIYSVGHLFSAKKYDGPNQKTLRTPVIANCANFFSGQKFPNRRRASAGGF